MRTLKAFASALLLLPILAVCAVGPAAGPGNVIPGQITAGPGTIELDSPDELEGSRIYSTGNLRLGIDSDDDDTGEAFEIHADAVPDDNTSDPLWRIGEDGVVRAGSAWTTFAKDVTESVTSSTTLQTDDDLQTGLPAFPAGAFYKVDMLLSVSGDGDADLKIAFDEVAGTIAAHGHCTVVNETNNTVEGTFGALGGSTAVVIPLNGSAVVSYAVHCQVGVEVLTGPARIALQWAQNTSNGSPTSVIAKSYWRWIRVK